MSCSIHVVCDCICLLQDELALIQVLHQKKIGSHSLKVVQSDICDITTDAIVHPTNSTLSTGGQIGHALSSRGGASFREQISRWNASARWIYFIVLFSLASVFWRPSSLHDHSTDHSTLSTAKHTSSQLLYIVVLIDPIDRRSNRPRAQLARWRRLSEQISLWNASA